MERFFHAHPPVILSDEIQYLRDHVPSVACGHRIRLCTNRCHCFGEARLERAPVTIKQSGQSFCFESFFLWKQFIETLQQFQYLVAVGAGVLELTQRPDYIGMLDAHEQCCHTTIGDILCKRPGLEQDPWRVEVVPRKGDHSVVRRGEPLAKLATPLLSLGDALARQEWLDLLDDVAEKVIERLCNLVACRS